MSQSCRVAMCGVAYVMLHSISNQIGVSALMSPRYAHVSYVVYESKVPCSHVCHITLYHFKHQV